MTKKDHFLKWVYESFDIPEGIRRHFEHQLHDLLEEAKAEGRNSANITSHPHRDYDDHDFSMFRRWKDDPPSNDHDDHGGIIKHFQD